MPEIMISKKTIDEEFIADIYYLDKNKVDTNVRDLLKSGKREIIELEDTNPFDIIVLPNSKLIFPDTINKHLALYDQNFNLIRKIDRTNGEKIDPTGFALNQKESKIYISDHHNHRILMTDLELNLIKTIGSRGNENYQFRYPRGMCFCKNGLLYITDYLNGRVQILNRNLEYTKTLKVMSL
jgi:DNA-binding beta-propeller fold protein YncE